MLGNKTLIRKIAMDALKAVVLATPTLPKKKTAALSLIPKSPREIGSIDFTSNVDETA